jgi:putative endonuclease
MGLFSKGLSKLLQSLPKHPPKHLAKNLADHLRRGRQGEDLALDHLRRQGLTLLERNYNSPWGEIDLVMSDAAVLVFVEVRLRAETRYGSAAETIGPQKRRRLTRTAEHYLQRHRSAPARFDVIAITTTGGADSDPHRLEWIKDAFQT